MRRFRIDSHKILVMFVFTLGVNYISSADSSIPQPDFAYPKTVLADAEKQLAVSESRGNEVGAINAMLQILRCNNEIGGERSEFDNIERVNAFYNESQFTPGMKAVALTLRAIVYKSAYSNNQYKYNTRETPDSPIPADPSEWNGRQWQNKINTLCDSAMGYAQDLIKMPIEKYSSIVEIDAKYIPYFPTMLDFVVSRCIKLNNESSDKYRSIAESMHPKGSASYIYWRTESLNDLNSLIKFIESDIHNPNMDIAVNKLYQYSISYTKEGANESEATAVYALTEKFLSYNKNSNLYNRLKVLAENLKTPYLRFSGLEYVTPNLQYEIKFHITNLTDFEVGLFKCDKKEAELIKTQKFNADLTKRKSVVSKNYTADLEVPFACDTTLILNVGDIPAGDYFVGITPKGSAQIKDKTYYYVRCIKSYPFSVSNTDNKCDILVLNPLTGSPIADKEVRVIEGDKAKIFANGKTNANGVISFELPTTLDSGNLKIFVSNDSSEQKDSFSIYIPRHISKETKPTYSSQILTDRSIYHRGDNVNWAAVVYTTILNSKNVSESRVKEDYAVKVSLYDANDKEISVQNHTTDSMGRISGNFKVPADTDLLTGEYSIRIESADNSHLGSTYVTVSDYKIPSFYVEVNSLEKSKGKENKYAKIIGKATTMDGRPIQNAKIDVNFSSVPYFYRYRGNFTSKNAIFNLNTTTDNDGVFTFKVFKDSLDKQNKFENMRYCANISATSISGETQQTAYVFTFGKPYTIDAQWHNTNIETSKYYLPEVKVTDANADVVDTPVNWNLLQGDNCVAKGTFTKAGMDFAKIAPGRYSLKLFTSDASLADTISTNVVLYNTANPKVPTEGFIFLPTREVDMNGTILIGCATDSLTIFYNESQDSKLNINRIRLKKGWNTVNIQIDNSIDNSSLQLFGIKNCVKISENINVPKRKVQSLTLTSQNTFRNKLVPGDIETWRITVTDSDKKPLRAALVADIYNKALDFIKPHRFGLNTPTPYGLNNTFISSLYISNSYAYINCVETSPESFGISSPDFRYLIQQSITVFSSSNLMRSAKKEPAMMYVMESSVTLDSADGGVEEAEDEADDSQESKTAFNKVELREVEMPIALWLPNLTTGDDGVAVIEFRVPNALASWNFCAAAWTNDMVCGNMSHSFTTTKPVTAQANMPRFVREGDSVTVLTTLSNNSDTTAIVEARIEIFDPYTNSPIKTYNYSKEIAANSSEVVHTQINADVNLSGIGIKTVAIMGKYSDGEQNVIPILPASQELVEAERFYLDAKDKDFTIALPEDANITLEYTSNPIWTVVSALPILINSADNSVFGQSAALFSAASAKGILNKMPQLRKAINSWSANPSDSILVSPLNKNNQLKMASLEATPWVQSAETENQRMERLATIFSSQQTDSIIAKATSSLCALQTDEGGWRWGSWSDKPSQYVTELVLERIGLLKHLGYLPKSHKDIYTMAHKAIKWLDNNVEGVDYRYTCIRTLLWNDVPNTTNGRAVIQKTIQIIKENWKEQTAPVKATEAEILWCNGERTLAREIMKSVAEYATIVPGKGAVFNATPSLNSASNILRAYSTIQPNDTLVDAIRQNIILRKRSQDWGTSILTTDAISSLLMSGTDYSTTNALSKTSFSFVAPDSITADIPGDKIYGRKAYLVPYKLADITGHIVTDISAFKGDTLMVTKSAKVPSFGSVYVRKNSKMSEIQAVSQQDLSIEKLLTVSRKGKWEAVEAGTPLKVGDKVRVNLVIHNRGERLDYVTIVDQRPAAFEPVNQLPGWMYSEGVGFYRENNDATSTMFVDYMPRGTYILSYDMYVNNAGTYSSGAATLQSQYSPDFVVHSSAMPLTVEQ